MTGIICVPKVLEFPAYKKKLQTMVEDNVHLEFYQNCYEKN